jgi:hypothetical protein
MRAVSGKSINIIGRYVKHAETAGRGQMRTQRIPVRSILNVRRLPEPMWFDVGDLTIKTTIARLLRLPLSACSSCLLLFVFRQSHGDVSDAFAEGSFSAKAQDIRQATMES